MSAVQVRPAVFKRRHMSGYGYGKKSVFILVQPTAGGFDPRCRYLSTLAAHERRGLSFQMSKAAVVLGNGRNTGTQRGKMT